MAKSVEDMLNEMQVRALATDTLFQSLFAALESQQKQTVINNVRHNFDAFEKGTHDELMKQKLAAARAVATRVLGN